MKYGYIAAESDEVPTGFETHLSASEPQWLAEKAAEHYWNDSDQDPDDWPMTFELFTEGGVSLGKFRISLDFDPSFWAEKL